MSNMISASMDCLSFTEGKSALAFDETGLITVKLPKLLRASLPSARLALYVSADSLYRLTLPPETGEGELALSTPRPAPFSFP
jgi:hypothetical protein